MTSLITAIHSWENLLLLRYFYPSCNTQLGISQQQLTLGPAKCLALAKCKDKNMTKLVICSHMCSWECYFFGTCSNLWETYCMTGISATAFMVKLCSYDEVHSIQWSVFLASQPAHDASWRHISCFKLFIRLLRRVALNIVIIPGNSSFVPSDFLFIFQTN